MSNQFKPDTLRFYITPEHQCPYLSEQKAKTIFLSPEVEVKQLLYSALMQQGFRRSGEHIYRPQCDQCKACISVRVPVNSFKPNRQQRRCLSKAGHFRTQIEPAHFDQQQYQLFENYINERHRDGDMYPTSPEQYKEFLLNPMGECNFMNFIDVRQNKLVATCVFDVVSDGLSAVYTYFDADYSRYSLGRLAVLKLVELARFHQLDYLYLGYWINNCRKMAYKGEYRPLQCYLNDQWIQLN